jgi:hypothetical protein
MRQHDSGFFSTCSLKLQDIVLYLNKNNKFPEIVDCSKLFSWYKPYNSFGDINFDYFKHYNNIDISYNGNYIDYDQNYQFINYNNLDFQNICPIIKKYFTPSNTINNIITELEIKYNLDYDNICVLFYRGNDKVKETQLCCYEEYINYANYILEKKSNIKFLIQSDETEFINFFKQKYPNNSFYFKDEIRHMSKCYSSVDINMKDKNYIFSKYYLAITIIMSRCNYIIFGSGNCSIWIVLYRGNNNNVYQYLNGEWIKPV